MTAAIKLKEEEYERAREKVTEAYREMRKAEIIRDDLMEKTKKHEQALEQVELDEIAQNIHRRTSKVIDQYQLILEISINYLLLLVSTYINIFKKYRIFPKFSNS